MADDRHGLTSERQLGYEQGEGFDRHLREREHAEREERLSRLAWGVGEAEDALDTAPLPPELSTLQLRNDFERFRSFHDAVQKSRAWRLAQRLRAVVGRAW